MNYATVNVLKCGEVYIDRALSHDMKSCHPAPYTGWLRRENKKYWAPVSAYLIHHPQKGIVLIDTGWHKDVRKYPRKHLNSFLYSMFKPKLTEGEAIDEQLTGMGIEPKDLEYVILTHLHADHVSGLEHVKDAKRIIVSEQEYKSAQKSIGYNKNMWKGTKLETFTLQDVDFGPYQLGLDLFGDNIIHLVHTPGHSEGMISVLVNTKNGWVILGSDVGYSKESIQNLTLPGLMSNKMKALSSLLWLKSFTQRPDFSKLFFNHDPEFASWN